jgi:membrane protein DedA with SNARE-associated domain
MKMAALDFAFLEVPTAMMTILLIILVLLLLGVVPAWPHSRSWGYGPSGILGVILIVVIVMVLMGRA